MDIHFHGAQYIRLEAALLAYAHSTGRALLEIANRSDATWQQVLAASAKHDEAMELYRYVTGSVAVIDWAAIGREVRS